MPLYQLDILMSEAARVEARALRYAIQATTAPHLKPNDRRALLRRLDSVATVKPPEPEPMAQTGAHDPVAAAAWTRLRIASVIVPRASGRPRSTASRPATPGANAESQ
jgi:hypothetical protein